MAVEMSDDFRRKALAKRDELLRGAPPSVGTGSASTAIRVVARVRPVLADEQPRLGQPIDGATATSHAQSEYEAVVTHGTQVFCLSEERKIGTPTGNIAAQAHPTHRAFGPDATNAQIFDTEVVRLVECALAGGAATMIAYGQTGSGKTYTISAMHELVAERVLSGTAGASLSVSFFENIGAKCFDLLNERDPLEVRESAAGEVVVVGLRETSVRSADELRDVLARGSALRKTRATKANDQSSRSHAICTLALPSGGSVRLVDLAGSERREDAMEHGEEALLEMKDINSTLGTLKECIRATLRRATIEPGAHVPFRRSKLTMLLRSAFEARDSTAAAPAADSEGTDAARAADPAASASSPALAVLFIAHVSPLRSHAKHTVNTLDYAAQMIQATMAERQRAEFDEVEKWSSKKLVAWVAQLDGGKYERIAHAFARCTGKMLAVEYREDVAQWVRAAGGSDADADHIYDSFRALHQKAKAEARRRKAAAGGATTGAARSAAAARGAATQKGAVADPQPAAAVPAQP